MLWSRSLDGGYSEAARIRPRHNRAVIWLNTPGSYHSVVEISSIVGSRRTVYIAISSRERIWPDDDVSRKGGV
jgi:hypothetical protein